MVNRSADNGSIFQSMEGSMFGPTQNRGPPPNLLPPALPPPPLSPPPATSCAGGNGTAGQLVAEEALMLFGSEGTPGRKEGAVAAAGGSKWPGG